VDAIPPATLRKLIRDRIRRHVNKYALKTLQAAEESERELLTALARNMTPFGGH
jgi:hypothetical protein